MRGQAPLVYFLPFRRCICCLYQHSFEVCFWIVEEVFKVQVVHQYNSYHSCQPGEACYRQDSSSFYSYHFAINTIYNTVYKLVNFSFELCVKMVAQEAK